MIALSFHAVFEGIALGLQKTTQSTVNIVIAIAIHKAAAGLSLGIALNKNFPDNFKIVGLLMATFAFASPLGCAVGMGLEAASPIVNIVFSSLAAGTFVYIACSEVVVEEFSMPG